MRRTRRGEHGLNNGEQATFWFAGQAWGLEQSESGECIVSSVGQHPSTGPAHRITFIAKDSSIENAKEAIRASGCASGSCRCQAAV